MASATMSLAQTYEDFVELLTRHDRHRGYLVVRPDIALDGLDDMLIKSVTTTQADEQRMKEAALKHLVFQTAELSQPKGAHCRAVRGTIKSLKALVNKSAAEESIGENSGSSDSRANDPDDEADYQGNLASFMANSAMEDEEMDEDYETTDTESSSEIEYEHRHRARAFPGAGSFSTNRTSPTTRNSPSSNGNVRETYDATSVQQAREQRAREAADFIKAEVARMATEAGARNNAEVADRAKEARAAAVRAKRKKTGIAARIARAKMEGTTSRVDKVARWFEAEKARRTGENV